MNFFVGKASGLPIEAQLQEQIKLALLIGQLRPGDTLPSIRDVAAQIGVNRGLVHKAYMELQNAGILALKQGKGVIVDKDLRYDHQGMNRKAETIAEGILHRLRTSGICPSAFARYLYHKAQQEEDAIPFIIYADITKSQATERAQRIASIWQVHIEGVSFEELASMEGAKLKSIRKLLTSYLRVDRVSKIVSGTGIEVIPIQLKIKPETLHEFKKWPNGVSVLIVVDDSDIGAAPFIVDLYKREFLPPDAKVTAQTLGQMSVKRMLQSSKYHHVIFATSVWERLPHDLKRHARATHPQLDIDLASVESARINSGVIV